MAIDSGHVLRVTAEGQLYDSVVWNNVFYVRVEEKGAASDQDIVDSIVARLDGMYDHFVPIMSDQLSFTQIEVYDLTADEPVATEPWPTLTTGDSAADMLVTGAALVVRFFTAVKRSQGRKFIPGLGEGQTVGGVWALSALQAAGSFAIDVLTPFTEDNDLFDGEFGLYRRASGTFIPLLSGIVNAIPGYQRRRKEGVGI